MMLQNHRNEVPHLGKHLDALRNRVQHLQLLGDLNRRIPQELAQLVLPASVSAKSCNCCCAAATSSFADSATSANARA